MSARNMKGTTVIEVKVVVEMLNEMVVYMYLFSNNYFPGKVMSQWLATGSTIEQLY